MNLRFLKTSSFSFSLPAEAARAFLNQRLNGGVQRSNEMLRPTKIGGVFVSGPKAT
jgi:hypothetical protein